MRKVLPSAGGASGGGGACWGCGGLLTVACCGMCCVWSRWLVLLPPDPLDDEPDDDEPDDDEPVDGGDVLTEKSGIGISARSRRSSGISGGGIGGWPLISNGPLALFSSVDQPPLPSVEPMLHDT